MGLVFCLLVILAAFVGYFKWKQSYWQRRGVPGPRGIPFLGSFYEIADKENPRVFVLHEWTKIHETVDNSVLCMMDHLAKHENNSAFNIHLYFQELTYDIICRLAMGQPYSEQFNNEGVEIVKNEENKQLGIENTQNDFIDMFLDHYTESEIEDSQFGTPFERKVNSQDVIGACFVFLLAGFDTTANTLAYASYLLAKNPEKMQMVQEEVDRTCDSDIISYDDLTRMNYLDAVIREALRLYPVAWFACSRECVSTTTLGEYVIEKGVRVEADLMALHRSKEIWGENADDFVPERWFVETRRPSMSWIPFGAGPRQCVGMRLGLCETKTAFAHILRKYSIVAGPETEDKLRILGCTTNCPESVTVYLESRFCNP
uniref:Cytochrome P450 n=1 Tax=Caenorhabditis tropicalis TaxID=1561998 RepID=A0A1I7TRP2_9PELO